MKTKSYPKHMASSQREFKSRKRKEWREVMLALSEYQMGCAYSPAYEDFKKIQELAKKVAEKQSVKNWGN